SVSRTTAILTEENEFLNSMAASQLENCELIENGNLHFLTQDCEVILDREKLSVLPDPLLKRCIRFAVEFLGATLEYEPTLIIAQSIKNAETGAITAEGGKIVVEFHTDKVHIRELQTFEPFRFPLTIPGDTESDLFGWKLTAESWSV